MNNHWQPEEKLVGKVDELAASLHATTDVLSTADRMLGHYRDLNREQDAEISRLNRELVSTRHPEVSRRSRGRNLPRTPSYSDLDERRPRPSNRVRFTDEESTSELEEFESAIRNLNKKQNRLQKELRRDRRRRSGDLLSSPPRQDSNDGLLEKRLSEIQHQLELDKAKKLWKEDSVDKLADEIRQIRGFVQAREAREPMMTRADFSNSRPHFEELQLEKEKSLRDQETISDLRRQLRQREDDQERLLSQLQRSKALNEESEGNQQRSKIKMGDLESKLEREAHEKRKLENELEAVRGQNSRATRENTELVTQLNLLRDKKSSPDLYSTELQLKLNNLENQRAQSVEKLNSCKIENERKDILIERLQSQIRDLTSHTEKAEVDKRKYIGELEEAMKRLRDSMRNAEDLKSLLREQGDDLKSSEDKRQDLKSKALEAIKDYRSKNRDLEREKKRLQDRGEVQEEELSRARAEVRDFESINKKDEQQIRELKKLNEKLQSELQRQQNQIMQMGYEKAQLEEGLTTSLDTRKETTKLQYELQEMRAKGLATENQLAEEAAKRRELEDQLQETREKAAAAKDEAANLYQQIQEDRLSHSKAMRQMEEELQSLSSNEERTMKELMEKANQEKSRYEEEIRLLKLQIAQEKMNTKANQSSQEEQKEETQKLSYDLKRKSEENRKIRSRYLLLKNDCEEKIKELESNAARDKERIKELEDELRKNQENLLQTREFFKQSLRDIHLLTDSLLDVLMQETSQSKPTSNIPDAMHLDPKRWSSEILEQLRKCTNLLKNVTDRSSKLSSQLTKSKNKIQEMLESCDQDKKYFMGELEKQNELIENFKIEKKYWDKKMTEKKKAINKLQIRVEELTKHLEQCTKVLHASMEAIGDRERVLIELDDLQVEHNKKSKLHENYVRHEERIESLHEKLEDAKMALQGVKDENLDATLFNLKFLKSLSPAPKRRFEENFPVQSRRLPEDLRDDRIFQSPPRLSPSDIEDGLPSPPKRSKEHNPMKMTHREINDMYVQN